MSGRINILKLFAVFTLAVLLHGCGDDQPANQGDDTAATVETELQAAGNESQAEAPQQSELASAAGNIAMAAEENTQESAAEVTDSSTAATDTSQTPQYHVECDDSGSNCRVNMETYIGWRMYRSQCAQCHGQDAQGSTFAPSLLDRLNQRVDYPRFVDVVTNGYRGQMGVMPAWKENKSVMEHMPNLYMYLKARADGVLDADRPKRLE